MAIHNSDVKPFESQRLTDEEDGGGRITGNEVIDRLRHCLRRDDRMLPKYPLKNWKPFWSRQFCLIFIVHNELIQHFYLHSGHYPLPEKPQPLVLQQAAGSSLRPADRQPVNLSTKHQRHYHQEPQIHHARPSGSVQR